MKNNKKINFVIDNATERWYIVIENETKLRVIK